MAISPDPQDLIQDLPTIRRSQSPPTDWGAVSTAEVGVPTTQRLTAKWLIPGSIAVMVVGVVTGNLWVGLIGGVITLVASLWLLGPFRTQLWKQLIPPKWRVPIVAGLGLLAATFGLLLLWGTERSEWQSGSRFPAINWEAIGAISEALGALG
ncbi:MAG: hypothetical protein AAGF75_05435, partial [Cyanobacteria bacterium P01_H01_bin.130]